MAIWYPLGGVFIKTLLSYRKTGDVEKWFSLTNPALKGLPLRYRWSSEIPLLCDAPSTHYYFECEKWLFEQYFPDFASKRVV